jgi:hypothetical protein
MRPCTLPQALIVFAGRYASVAFLSLEFLKTFLYCPQDLSSSARQTRDLRLARFCKTVVAAMTFRHMRKLLQLFAIHIGGRSRVREMFESTPVGNYSIE